MKFELTTGPTLEPVSIGDLVGHLQIGELPDDQQIRATAMLTAARQWVENRLHRQLITSTWTAYLGAFPEVIEIKDKLPVSAVASVKYYDDDNSLQTLSSSNYETDIVSENSVPRIRPAFGYSWPLTYSRYNAVQVALTCGYGATRESVPMGIRHAILIIAADLYENREDTVIGQSVNSVPIGVEYCLQPFDWGFYA